MPAPKAVRVKTSTGWQDVALMGPQGPGGSAPIGALSIYSGAADPTDSAWLIADGRAISRTTYADYFGLVSTTYGVGNGTTTFNIPNLKGKVPVGRDAADGAFDVLGETGGAKDITLTEAQMPSHRHLALVSGSGGGQSGLAFSAVTQAYSDVGNPANPIIANTGSGTSHSNLQPYIALNYIIRVLPLSPGDYVSNALFAPQELGHWANVTAALGPAASLTIIGGSWIPVTIPPFVEGRIRQYRVCVNMDFAAGGTGDSNITLQSGHIPTLTTGSIITGATSANLTREGAWTNTDNLMDGLLGTETYHGSTYFNYIGNAAGGSPTWSINYVIIQGRYI